MKKVDKILKRADVFEKLTRCETKESMRRVLAQVGYSSMDNPPPAPAPAPAPKPAQYSAAESLKTKDQVLAFQKNITYYASKNPAFAKQLNAALGGIEWGKGKNRDLDGILGKRTETAWKQYQIYANKLNPSAELHSEQNTEENTNLGAQYANTFRQYLRHMRAQLDSATKGFTVKSNVGSDSVKAKWFPWLQPAYTALVSGYQNYPEKLKEETSSLVSYMNQLFKSYTTVPPEEPKSLIDIDNPAASKYTPTSI